MSSLEQYVGGELRIFEHAINWKEYYRRALAPFIQGDVLEVGSGLGGTTAVLSQCAHREWTCLEPDRILSSQTQQKIELGQLPRTCNTLIGTIEDISPDRRFDTILYIDVLEHIENHRGELMKASQHLTATGNLIVLSPAHQSLFTPFDQSIGHYRRYNKASLRKIAPPNTCCLLLRYLDCIGMLASFANRILLKQSMPSLTQILFWDRVLVPISCRMDWIFNYKIGKSILAVWTRNGN